MLIPLGRGCDLTASWALPARSICGVAPRTVVLAALAVTDAPPSRPASWRDSLTLWKHAMACTGPNCRRSVTTLARPSTLADGHQPEVLREAIRLSSGPWISIPTIHDPQRSGHCRASTATRSPRPWPAFSSGDRTRFSQLKPHKNLATCWSRRGNPKPRWPSTKRPCGSTRQPRPHNHLADLTGRPRGVRRGHRPLHGSHSLYRRPWTWPPSLPSVHLAAIRQGDGRAGTVRRGDRRIRGGPEDRPQLRQGPQQPGDGPGPPRAARRRWPICREAVRIDPEFSEAYGNLAWVLVSRERSTRRSPISARRS